MDKTKAMIVLALAILLLGTGAALASSSDDETTAAPPPDGGDGIVDMIAGLCDTGWEAGVKVELDASTAYEAAKTILLSIPIELLETNELFKFISQHPDYDYEMILSAFLGEDDISALEVDAHGYTYLHSTCVDTSDGYVITVRATGSLSLVLRMDIINNDQENPDISLYRNLNVISFVDAATSVYLTKDMVPTSINYGYDINLDLSESYNCGEFWDSSGHSMGYQYIGEKTYSSNTQQHTDSSSLITGMTADDLESILYGGEDVQIQVQSYGFNILEYENEYIETGSEYSYPTTIHAGILDQMNVDESTLTDLIDDDSLIPDYNALQTLLVGFGLFIPENDYDSIVNGLMTAYDMLNDQYLDFYYIYDDSTYNENLKDEVLDMLSDITVDLVSKGTDLEGDYLLTYYRTTTDGPFTINQFISETEEVPTEIHGVDAVYSGHDSPYIYDLIQDGIGYTFNEDSWGARVIEENDTVTIPATMAYEGIDYPINYVYVEDLTLKSLIIASDDTYVRLVNSQVESMDIYGTFSQDDGIGHMFGPNYTEGSSIGTLTYHCDGPYIVFMDWLNDLSHLESLVFDGDVLRTEGTVSVPGYSGIGSTIVQDGILYELAISNGKRVASILEILDSHITLYAYLQSNGEIYETSPLNSVDYSWVTDIEVVSIPDKYMWISSPALENVIFNNTDKIDIPPFMFEACDRLERVEFNGPVGTINSNAFYQCSEIRYLEFNDTVDEIGSAFFPLGRVTELVFEADVGTVGNGSFDSFTKLQSVHFKGNVGEITHRAFTDCESLASITVDGNLGTIGSQDNTPMLTNIMIHGNLGTILNGSFADKYTYEDVDGEAVEVPWYFTVDGHVDVIESDAFGWSGISEFVAGEGIGFVDGFAFYETAIDPGYILSISDTTSPDALNGTYDSNGDWYSGISSGSTANAEPVDGIEYDVMKYKLRGDVVLGIVGIATDLTTGHISIPEMLVVDGEEYPVRSIGYDNYSRSIDGIFQLTIGSHIEWIGSGLSQMFNDATVTDLVIGNTEDYRIDTTNEGVYVVIDISIDPNEMIAVINGLDVVVDTFVVPEGIEILNLDLFDRLSIRTLVTGDDLKWIEGEISSTHGLEYLEIGASLEYFDYWNSPTSLKYITVDPSNTTYVSYDGILYEHDTWEGNDELRLVLSPASLVGHGSEGEYALSEYTIPDSVTVGDATYPVGYIGDWAFSNTSLTKIVVGNNVHTIYTNAFWDSSSLMEVIVPSDIIEMNGAFDFVNPELQVYSIPDEDGFQSVYTIDGAIYHITFEEWMYDVNGSVIDTDEPVAHKRMIGYIGNDDMVIVEEGTEEAVFGDVCPDLVILPQEIRVLDDHAWSTGDVPTYTLIPSAAYDQTSSSNDNYVFRAYQISDDYDITFEVVENGIRIDVTGKPYATVNGFILDSVLYDSGSTVPFDVLFPYTPTGGIYDDVITIDYTVPQYDVTFEVGGSAQDIVESVYHGQRVDIPADPVRAGFEFDEWYSDEDCTEPFDFESPITGPTTVYAGWLPVYTVSVETEGVDFYIDGEYIDGSITVAEGEYYIDMYIQDGYEGEYRMYADGQEFYGTLTVDENIVLTADVTPKPTHYRVTFLNDPSMGTYDGPSYIDVPMHEGVTLPDVQPYEGFRFVGWVLGFTIVQDGMAFDSDVTLTAAYVQTDVIADITFSLDAQYGKSDGKLPDYSVEPGTEIQLPEVTAKNKYIFLGWTADGNIIEGDIYIATHDVRLKAVFEEIVSGGGNDVQVSLHIDRSEGQHSGNKTITLDRGDEYTLPEVGDKRGFHLVAWSIDGIAYQPGATITVDDDITATAIFQRTTDTPETHVVTYRLPTNLGSMNWPAAMYVYDGQNIQLPDVTAADGYIFDGWYLDGEMITDFTTVESDMTITAKLSAVTQPEPDEPDRGEGSTVITTEEDGTVREETTWEDGSTTTTVTNPDGSATKVDESDIENGTQRVEEVYDTNGDLSGSTTTTETSVTTGTGTKIDTTTTVVKDGTGKQTSEVTNITADSGDGTRTDVSIVDGDISAVTSIAKPQTGTGPVNVDINDITNALDRYGELSDIVGDTPTVINVESDAYTPDRAEVTVDADALELIAESGSSIGFGGESGTVTVGSDVAQNLSAYSEPVTITVGKGDKASMTPAQQEAAGDSPVFLLAASAGDTSVHEFEGDVTVTLPYTLRDGEDPDDVRVYYLDDDGGLHMRVCTYDPVTHTVSFVTDHFSVYMIGNVNKIDTVDPVTLEGDDYSIMYYPGENDFFVTINNTLSVGLLEAVAADVSEIEDIPDYIISINSGDLDADIMDALAAMDPSLTFVNENGALALSSESVEYLASKDGVVDFGIDVMTEEHQTESQLGISGGRPVYIPYIAVDGEQITDVPMMNTVLFYQTAEGEDPADVRLVSLNPEGGYTKVDATYADGTIVLEGCPSGEYTVRIGDSTPGDLNGDGRINLLDYYSMKDALNGLTEGIDVGAADLNGDGRINLLDYYSMKDLLNR